MVGVYSITFLVLLIYFTLIGGLHPIIPYFIPLVIQGHPLVKNLGLTHPGWIRIVNPGFARKALFSAFPEDRNSQNSRLGGCARAAGALSRDALYA